MPHGPMYPHIENIFSGWPFPGRGLLVPPQKPKRDPHVVRSWQGPFGFPQQTSQNVLLLVVAWLGPSPSPQNKQTTQTHLQHSIISPGGRYLAGAFLSPQKTP